MRVLVFGGRDYNNYERVAEELDDIGNISLIIHGGARGADSCGARYAGINNIPVREFPADWDKYGKRAGPIRNAQMLREGAPDFAVAFPGGKGTKDMIERCRKANIFVRIIK